MSSHHTRRRRTRAAVGVASAALLAAATATASPAQAGEIRGADAKGAVAGSYLVVLRDGHSTSSAARRHGAEVTYTYRAALNGYAAKMSEAAARRAAADPAVAYVEQDRLVRAFATQAPTLSWGLDRIDQRELSLDNGYTYPTTASNVTAYVIDTGIRTSHQDFGGRAVWGTNTADRNDTDCNGHGTHVAGTVGGTAYGVAKGVRLIAVKVLGCDGTGTTSRVVSGIDWVTAHHTSGPAVASLSFGTSGTSSAMEGAVRNSIVDGITYAIASGNSEVDACGVTPARVTEAITVNSARRDDVRSPFSNYGSCTDIFAPGGGITSASSGSDTDTETDWGTSSAAAHVAGAAALYLADNPAASPATVQAALKNNATKGVVSDPGPGSPNNLLYVGSGVTTPPPPGCYGNNGTDTAIPNDATPVYSDITITNCFRNASTWSSISVDIRHPRRGDLELVLVAPDGSTYLLMYSDLWDVGPNVLRTFHWNLSAEAGNGTWRLKAIDHYTMDSTGYIDSWQLVI